MVNQTRFCHVIARDVGGMSGSSVYYRGRIIGILTLGLRKGYPHMSWGPGVKQLKLFVSGVIKKWNKR